MNAQLPVQIEEIEVYSDLLSKEFVKETIDRHNYIQENRQRSLETVDTIKENFAGMAIEVKKLGTSLGKSSDTFNRLALASRESAEAFRKLSLAAQKWTDNLQKKN